MVQVGWYSMMLMEETIRKKIKGKMGGMAGIALNKH